MKKFFLMHTYKRPPEEWWARMGADVPPLAVSMAEGKTPARCLKTWNPLPYGRSDYFFCLWEAEKLEDIEATLAGTVALDYVTIDPMEVDEIDWVEMAKAAMAKEPVATGV